MSVCVDRTPRRQQAHVDAASATAARLAMNDIQNTLGVHCQLCDTRCAGHDGLMQHYRASPRHPHCSRCGQGFMDRRELDQHEAEKHPRVRCCGLSISKEDIGQHYFESVNHSRCNRCRLGFEDQNELESHNQTKHPRYVCRVCDKEFESDAALRKHSTAPGLHPQCEFCNRPFAHISALIEHYANTHLAEALQEPSSAGADGAEPSSSSQLAADDPQTLTPADILDDLDLSSLDPSELAEVLAELSLLAQSANNGTITTSTAGGGPQPLSPSLSSPVPSSPPLPLPSPSTTPSPLLLLRRRLLTPSPAPSVTPTPGMLVPTPKPQLHLQPYAFSSSTPLPSLPPLPASPPTNGTASPVLRTPPRSAISTPPRQLTISTPPAAHAHVLAISSSSSSSPTFPQPQQVQARAAVAAVVVATASPTVALATPPRPTGIRAPTPAETPSGDLSDSRHLAQTPTPLRSMGGGGSMSGNRGSVSPSVRASMRARQPARIEEVDEGASTRAVVDDCDSGESDVEGGGDAADRTIRVDDLAAAGEEVVRVKEEEVEVESPFVIGDDEPTPTAERSFEDLTARDQSPSPPPVMTSSGRMPRLVIELDTDDDARGRRSTPTTPTPSPKRPSMSPPTSSSSPASSISVSSFSSPSSFASSPSPPAYRNHHINNTSTQQLPSPPASQTTSRRPSHSRTSSPQSISSPTPYSPRISTLRNNGSPRASQSPSPPRVAGPRPLPPRSPSPITSTSVPRPTRARAHTDSPGTLLYGHRRGVSADGASAIVQPRPSSAPRVLSPGPRPRAPAPELDPRRDALRGRHAATTPDALRRLTTTPDSLLRRSDSPLVDTPRQTFHPQQQQQQQRRHEEGRDKKQRTPFFCRVCGRDPCEVPTATACGHLFCAGCIDREVRKSARCPVCESAVLLWGLLKLDVSDGEA